MPKYPRQQNGLFGLDSTAFLWAIIGATLLAGGFFLFGMYYGYQQGYEAAQASLDDEEPSRRASARPGSDSEPAKREKNRRTRNEERRPTAITADQLSGTEGTESAEDEPGGASDSPRAGVYGGSTETSTNRSQQAQSAAEDTATSGQDSGEDTTEESEESSPTPGDRPQALSVTRLDTEGGADDQSAEDTSSGTDQSESEPAPDTTDEAEETTNAIDAEGPTFTIQAVSFLKESRAEREVNELESKGYQASITEKVINGQRYFRVRVGSFADRTEADNAAQEMVKEGDIKDYWISRVKN